MEHLELINVMQAAIAPVVLISGAGLLLLSMVNRIARPIDRIRMLAKEYLSASEEDRVFYAKQIKVLYKRCYLLKNAIGCAIVSITSVSIIVLLLFLGSIFTLNITLLIQLVFIVCLIALISSLVFLLSDIKVSLKSVKIEMQRIKINLDT